jgi:LysR family transcriptional regulator, cys regulon transcriptional activator
MTLTELRCLLAIVDADLNISAAAQRLHATQPSLSRQLRQLEDELGFQLFTRHGRCLSGITAEGREVVRMARRIVGDAASLRAFAANLRGDATGELVLVAPQTYARHVLPSALARLVERYPQLDVRIQTLGEGATLERQASPDADLVLVSTAGERVPDGNALPLFRWRRVVLVPRDHPLTRLGHAPDLAELAAWPLVTYEASRRPQSTLNRALEQAGLQARFACSAEDADLVKAYVRAGLGVGLVAELAIEPGDEQEFAVLPADPVLPDCIAWAVLPAHRLMRDYTVDLIGLLAPQLETADIRRVLEQAHPPDAMPSVPRVGRAAFAA